MANLKAISDSVSHWERMISWAETQPPEGQPNSALMKSVLSEAWYGSDCALCTKFYTIADVCTHCPLEIRMGMGCSDKGSLWHSIIAAYTWKEWLKGAFILLTLLQEIRDKAKSHKEVEA